MGRLQFATRGLFAVVVAMFMAGLCPTARADFSFNKIADTSTPIPNGTGNFTSFDHAPIIRGGGGIAFRGMGAGQEGIYVGGPSPLVRVADRNTIMPNTTSPFATFGSPSGVGGNIVFNGSNATQNGIYEAPSGGALLTIDDGPAATTNFGQVAAVLNGPAAYRKNGQIFRGTGAGSTPLTFTPPAGVTDVQFLGDPDIGVNEASGGSVPLAVSVRYMKNGQLHGGVAIDSFGVPDRIVFETPLGSPGQASINWTGAIAVEMEGVGIRYIEFGGFPESTIPLGTFTDFGAVSAGSPNIGPYDTHVIFVAETSGGGKGIFAQGHPYDLVPIIQVGQTLDGKIVQDVDLGRDAEVFIGFAFWASFTDGSQGIYRANIPEPATAVVLLPVALIFARHRRRA